MVDHGEQRLRTRTVKAPPVLPPCSNSVPLNVLHNITSCSGLDTTDAESIQNHLQFATKQMQEWHCIVSDVPDTTSVDSSSPTLQQEGDINQCYRPSEGDYMTPQKLMQDPHKTIYQHTTPPEKDMENPRNRQSGVMMGKAFFDFQDNKYWFLHNR